MHKIISDAFLITTDSKDTIQTKGPPKTFLYEFSTANNGGEPVQWGVNDMDVIICNRLAKNN